MHRTLALAFGLFLGVPAAWSSTVPSAPPAGADGTVWLCHLSDDATQLVCVADGAAAAEASPAPAGATAPAPAMVRGTRFPLDPRQRWTVDLWSPFSGDPAWLDLLAQSTLCHRSRACSVFVHLPDRFGQAPVLRRGAAASR